jgi:uncharacterized protein (UPF0332 family)
MDDRHTSDYEIEISVATQVAEKEMADARLFVERIEGYLRQEG